MQQVWKCRRKYKISCSKCGNVEERDKPNTKNPICFDCKKERQRQYYHEHKDRMNEQNRIYRMKNSEKIKKRAIEKYQLRKLEY